MQIEEDTSSAIHLLIHTDQHGLKVDLSAKCIITLSHPRLVLG